jgi:tetratricopeptide (TPR) repeat protein
MKRPSPSTLGVALGLAAALGAVVLAYRPALSGEFQFDDGPSIVENLAIKDLPAFLRRLAEQPISAEARPVADLSFALDYARAGLDARAFHATSVLLHLVAVALAFLLVRALARRTGDARAAPFALAVAAAWGLHPLATQAVSYVVQRAEVLASIFALSTVLLLLAAEERFPRPRALALWALAAAAYGVGLGAKLVAITAPAAYLLASWSTRPAPPSEPGPSAPRRPHPVLPALLAAPLLGWAGWLAWRFVAGTGHRTDVGFDMPSIDAQSFAVTQLRVVLHYARLVLWPSGQNVDYSIVPSRWLGDPEAALAGAALLALALAGLGALTLGVRRRGTPAGRGLALGGAGVLWFFLVVAPSSSVVPIVDLAMEHRAYLASLGLVLALFAAGRAALASAPWPARTRALAPAAAAAGVAAALFAATSLRNEVWRSRVALWTDVVAKSPGKARAHFNLAHALSEANQEEAALRAYRAALPLARDGTVRWGDLMRNMGASLLGLNRFAEAAELLAQATAMEPYNPELENNLGIAYLELGRLPEARQHAQRAVGIKPDYAAAHNTLGEALYLSADYPAALAEFDRARHFDPDSLPALNNYATTLQHLGRTPDACRAWAAYGASRGGYAAARAQQKLTALGCAPLAVR